ncbi:hypothetical protein M0805_007738 [Coniferiporia weirii]|nr:hypothetical protein M0805_007738 [Coniferiporia weirii]
MKFSTLSAPLIAVAGSLSSVSAFVTTRATYDNTYDNPNGNMNSVACSNTPFGLSGRFPTFGSVPTFPNIGGSQFVTSSLSNKCGSCWTINAVGSDKPIYFTAIDVAGEGFNISEESMLAIANGTAIEVGSVEIQAVEVDSIYCGL